MSYQDEGKTEVRIRKAAFDVMDNLIKLIEPFLVRILYIM
jgi:hypothetical protein